MSQRQRVSQKAGIFLVECVSMSACVTVSRNILRVIACVVSTCGDVLLRVIACVVSTCVVAGRRRNVTSRRVSQGAGEWRSLCSICIFLKRYTRLRKKCHNCAIAFGVGWSMGTTLINLTKLAICLIRQGPYSICIFSKHYTRLRKKCHNCAIAFGVGWSMGTTLINLTKLAICLIRQGPWLRLRAICLIRHGPWLQLRYVSNHRHLSSLVISIQHLHEV